MCLNAGFSLNYRQVPAANWAAPEYSTAQLLQPLLAGAANSDIARRLICIYAAEDNFIERCRSHILYSVGRIM